MKKLYSVAATIAAILFLGLFSLQAAAAYPVVSASSPMVGYGWRLTSYEVFSDEGLKQKVGSLSYRACTVEALDGEAAKISYKVGQEKKYGWIDLGILIYDTRYQHQITFANAPITLYKRPTVKAKYTKVPMYSGGIAVSEKGSWVQVIFKAGSKYRLGWMKKSNFTGQVRLSMETTTQPLADGVYTISPRTSTSKALTYQSDRNIFRMEKNRKSQTQKFRLKYVKGSSYTITPLNAEGSLAENGLLSTSTGVDQLWTLSRSGGYFYIKSGQKSISSSSASVRTTKFKKVKSQQWQIRKISEKPAQETGVVFSQYDPKWGGSTYMNGPSRRTISTSGCGVVALTNAVYALNGEFINPKKIASFSVKRGHYFYNQGTADTLYKDYANKYGKMYHFRHKGKTYSIETMRKHLRNGGVAIALVPGHYIAIVGYKTAGKQYLVLDSAIYGKRPTTIHGDWLSASALKKGTLRCEYFHLLSRR